MARLGTETAFDVLSRAEALAREGRDIINLGIGQPDFKTAPHIVEAGIKALRDGHHGYTPPLGIPALREAVARDLERRYRVDVSPERIAIMPGGKPTMFFACLMFGQPGVEIMYPDPGFPIYRSMIEFTGATPVPMTLHEADGFAFRADDVLARITPATRLIILNSPGNPTGGVTPKPEIDALAAGLEAHPQVMVLSDEIYAHLLFDRAAHTTLLAYPHLRERVILLDGWSKAYAMTGWRLGYAVWPQSCIEAVTRLCVNAHSCVNAPTQLAGIAALEGPQDAIAAMVEAFQARRDVAVAALNAMSGVRCVVPGGAFYAFPNITGTGMDAKTLQTALLEEAGVATIAGTSFGAGGEGYLRLSFANSMDNIERALARMASLLETRAAP
ncbi:MAG: pyridoxal phosphate-dependent aminotransferase [Pseudomonadota bacterium]